MRQEEVLQSISEIRKKKRGARWYVFRCLYLIALVLVGVYLIFPFLYMVMRSIMNYGDAVNTNPVYFFPHSGVTFEIFISMFTNSSDNPYTQQGYSYLHYLWNTMKIALFNMIAVPLSGSLCAYSFSRIRWKSKNIIFAVMMASVMIPGSVLTVPQYVLFASMGWTESALPLTIPTLFGGGAMNIFLMVQFMRNIPYEIENAAKIDGANVFQRYLLITIPLCVPILIYIIIGTFNSVWGDFTGPLVYLKERSQWTLAVAIYYDSTSLAEGMDMPNVRMAICTFISLVPAIIFFFYQKTLIEGIQMGAIKG